jgi:hypothetical protein
MIPVPVKNTPLPGQIVPGLCMRERGHHGEFRQIKLYLQQKIYEAFDIVLGLVIQAQ